MRQMNPVASIFIRLARRPSSKCLHANQGSIPQPRTIRRDFRASTSNHVRRSSVAESPARVVTDDATVGPDSSNEQEIRPRSSGQAKRRTKGWDGTVRYTGAPRAPLDDRPIEPTYPEATADSESPRYRSRDTTMTVPEQDAFRRLFSSIKKRQAPKTGMELASFDDLDNPQEEMEDFAKLEAFPEPLRDMASKLQRDERVEAARQRQMNHPITRESSKLEEPIRKRLMGATADVEIWEILETDLFSKIRAMKLDQTDDAPTSTAHSPKTKMSNSSDAPPPELPSLPLFSPMYNRMIYLATRILCRRTSYTPYALAVLPAIKALGPSSYAMALSSNLFNELLSHQWRVYGTMGPMLSLLDEMDGVSCPMTRRTLDVLEEVTMYRWRASKGMLGEANKRLEDMPGRKREGQLVWEWKKRIRGRLQEAELERLRREEQVRELRSEGALGEEDDVSVGMKGNVAA